LTLMLFGNAAGSTSAGGLMWSPLFGGVGRRGCCCRMGD
jgi:hypothetical protein